MKQSNQLTTPYGLIDECDIISLEYKLWWYLRYGNLPTTLRREVSAAKVDYGFQYERYIGYLYARQGFRVEYRGLRDGLSDGGIDLIAWQPRRVLLIQCKRWAQPVDTDHLSRLQGAVERFAWEISGSGAVRLRTAICGLLITSGPATPAALELAKHLGLGLFTHVVYHAYPAIKARRIVPDGGRFLLPFDKGYDRVVMNFSMGDRFFTSIREALFNGFYYPGYHRGILSAMVRRRIHSERPAPANTPQRCGS